MPQLKKIERIIKKISMKKTSKSKLMKNYYSDYIPPITMPVIAAVDKIPDAGFK